MKKIEIAGLKIDCLTKAELSTVIHSRMTVGRKTWITTLYSEFLYASLKNPETMSMLNQADIAIADGIGILWATKFLSLPLSTLLNPPFFKGGGGGVNYWLKIIQAFWQGFWTLSLIILKPSSLKKIVPEKIVGADLIWDLAKLAEKNNWSIYLLGGFGNTPELAAHQLKIKNLKLKISGYSNKNPEDPSIYDDIKKASPDMLFVAYGPIRQERWIAQNLPNLPIKLAIGIGGTLDYIAGKWPLPPKFMRAIGLEWLWRLLTQPHRIKRILKATFGLLGLLWHYKIFSGYPMRKNIVSVILNKSCGIFIAKKSANYAGIKNYGKQIEIKWKQNYWQFPQGGIDNNEDIKSAALREIKEETGITNLNYLATSIKKFSYEYNNSIRPFWRNAKSLYRGQNQSIIYFIFTGTEKEISFPFNEEFSEYKWVNINELLNIIHKDKLPLATIVVEDLKEMREKGII